MYIHTYSLSYYSKNILFFYIMDFKHTHVTINMWHIFKWINHYISIMRHCDIKKQTKDSLL